MSERGGWQATITTAPYCLFSPIVAVYGIDSIELRDRGVGTTH
jgi:hypothetical protein